MKIDNEISLKVIPGSLQLLRMSDEEYFSDKYSDYISNSRLSLINPEEDGSIDKFKKGLESKYSSSLELGSSIHCMLLQPDEYEISDIRKPSGKLGVFAENVYLYRKEGYSIEDSIKLASEKSDYYKDKLTSKRLKTAIKESIEFYLNRLRVKESLDKSTIFLSKSMASIFDICISNIISNNEFMSTLYPKGIINDPEVYNEYAILGEIQVGDRIVKVKGKLDNFTIDHEQKIITLNDVKSTGKPLSFFMGNEFNGVYIPGSFEKYKYYRQLAMYLYLLNNCLNLEGYKYKANILAIETIPEYNSGVFKISDKWIKKGLEEFKNLLILVAYEC